jgi:Asp-tRNA(Asn)/Glu-tRNA(Gln) amidotransferase A subunit family amidase
MTIAFRTAQELAAEIRGGALSPVEAVDAALASIDALEPTLHAFITVDAEGARAAARAPRRARHRTRWRTASPSGRSTACRWRSRTSRTRAV